MDSNNSLLKYIGMNRVTAWILTFVIACSLITGVIIYDYYSPNPPVTAHKDSASLIKYSGEYTDNDPVRTFRAIYQGHHYNFLVPINRSGFDRQFPLDNTRRSEARSEFIRDNRMYVYHPDNKYLDPLLETVALASPDKQVQAKLLINIVQNLKYNYTMANLANTPSFKKQYPLVVLYYGEGVCGDRSLLAAALLARLGFETGIMVPEGKEHKVVLIGSIPPYTIPGTEYAVVEITKPSIITDSTDIPRGLIVPLSTGMKLTDLSEEFTDAKIYANYYNNRDDPRIDYDQVIRPIENKYGLWRLR